jgi:hypothetical protein
MKYKREDLIHGTEEVGGRSSNDDARVAGRHRLQTPDSEDDL